MYTCHTEPSVIPYYFLVDLFNECRFIDLDNRDNRMGHTTLLVTAEWAGNNLYALT